jgi:hypothetical protein
VVCVKREKVGETRPKYKKINRTEKSGVEKKIL